MARVNEAVSHLKKGLSPGEIAKIMGISFSSVMGYLHRGIGEGAIRRSDILFTIPKATREIVETLIKEGTTIHPITVCHAAERAGVTR